MRDTGGCHHNYQSDDAFLCPALLIPPAWTRVALSGLPAVGSEKRKDRMRPAHTPTDDTNELTEDEEAEAARLRKEIHYLCERQWTRFFIAPNIERWNHPGGLFGLIHDGAVDLATVPLPDWLASADSRDPWERQEAALLAAHPEIGTRVDPDLPHPGPGWARAWYFRQFMPEGR